MPDAIKRESQAVHGLKPCLCGCGRMVPQVKNDNGLVKGFFDDKCRGRWHSRARAIGQRMLHVNIPEAELRGLIEALGKMGPGRIVIADRALRARRRKRQEYVDLDAMTPEKRRRELCRAAWMVYKEIGLMLRGTEG